MIESLFCKADAHPWFREACEKLNADSAAIAQGWEIAWEQIEVHKAEPELWKGWVRQTVQGALSKAKSNPVGLWLTLLRNGPTSDLTKPTATPRRDEDEEAEGPGYVVTYEQLRAIRERDAKEHPKQQPVPPMAAVAELKARGWSYVDALARVQAEWEAQGRPWANEFDWTPLGLEVRTA